MARNFASIKVAIWADDDFRRLSPAAQHLYFVLLTSVDLELTGVTDWRPKRIAKLAGGWSERDVLRAAAELESARFAIFDEDTEQALVRTFIRHDGVLRNPKTAVGMVAKWGPLESLKLKAAIAETARDALRDGLSETVGSLIAPLLDYVPDYQSDTQAHGVSDQVAHSPASFSLPPVSINQEPREAASQAKRARQLPADWQPKPETVAAIRAELPGLDLVAEHRVFADHAKATGRAMKDWDAAWKNWMRKARQFGGGNTSRRQQETDDLFAAAFARAAAADRADATQPEIVEGVIL